MKKHLNLNIIHPFRLLAIFASLILLFFTFIYINNNNYNSLMNKFYSKFNNCEFEEAKEIIETRNITTIINNKRINTDLKNYFTSIVDVLCSDMKLGTINSNNALITLKEISNYEVLNCSLEKLILTLDPSYNSNTEHSYSAFIKLGEYYCNNNDFIKSLALLNKIPDTNTDFYAKAEKIINKCKDKYKEYLFSEADKLVMQDYYSKAIELLSKADINILGENNPDIEAKINKINILKEEYLASLDDSNSSSVMSQTISFSNINTLNIESETNYLLYVNLSEQQVYIYNGSSNNWSLINKYICSSGVQSEPTPTGVFTISTRGDWFFSEDYHQGGKYWIQFFGDYLFHSLPYNEEQDKILDYTLGKPASHGCIRLNTADMKWIYDNVPDNTKVIIQ